MNCQMFSNGFIACDLGGSGAMVMFSGTTRLLEICHPAWFMMRMEWALSATCREISTMCWFMARVAHHSSNSQRQYWQFQLLRGGRMNRAWVRSFQEQDSRAHADAGIDLHLHGRCGSAIDPCGDAASRTRLRIFAVSAALSAAGTDRSAIVGQFLGMSGQVSESR